MKRAKSIFVLLCLLFTTCAPFFIVSADFSPEPVNLEPIVQCMPGQSGTPWSNVDPANIFTCKLTEDNQGNPAYEFTHKSDAGLTYLYFNPDAVVDFSQHATDGVIKFNVKKKENCGDGIFFGLKDSANQWVSSFLTIFQLLSCAIEVLRQLHLLFLELRFGIV